MSWLVTTKTPNLRKIVHYLSTAYEIWTKFKKYEQKKNIVRTYQPNQQIKSFKQGKKYVMTYFPTLQRLWEELDHYLISKWESEVVRQKYEKQVERKKKFEFLTGLNSSFDAPRSRVPDSKLLSLDEVYEVIRAKEDRRGEMNPSLDSEKDEENEESMALVIYAAIRDGKPSIED